MSPQPNDEVQLCAFDILALDGVDLRKLPLSLRKTNLARLLVRRPDGIFVAPRLARSVPIYPGPRVAWVSKVWSQSTASAQIVADRVSGLR